jgi:hypothetical protein
MKTLTEINQNDLYSHIVKTIEAKKGVKISNPIAYAEKCISNNPDHWRSHFIESKNTEESRDYIFQDWQIEQIIGIAFSRKDYRYAIAI